MRRTFRGPSEAAGPPDLPIVRDAAMRARDETRERKPCEIDINKIDGGCGWWPRPHTWRRDPLSSVPREL